MFAACTLKHSSDVLLKARLSPPPHGAALAAFDKVNVVAEHAEPEGQVGVGDFVERVGRGVANGDHPSHVAGSPQPFQGVVDALLGASCDARPAARPVADRGQNPFIPSAPVQILAEDVHRVTDEDPGWLVGMAAKVVLD